MRSLDEVLPLRRGLLETTSRSSAHLEPV